MVLDENPLFHCSNLQGVILGVGLGMLEQLFSEQIRDVGVPRSITENKNTKKRKVGPAGTINPLLDIDDDEDDVYYGAKGKKAKGGIGYAGNVREDVSTFPWIMA